MFTRDVLTPERAKALTDAADLIKKARIFEGTTQMPFNFQAVDLDLTAERLENNPFPIRFPFKSVYVAQADQGASVVYLKPQTLDSYQSAVPLKVGDVLNFDSPVAAAYLFWNTLSLGANQSMRLLFFLDANFSAGRSLVQTMSPGSLSQFVITLPAATRTELTSSWFDFPTGGNPRKWNIYNNTGAVLYVGDASITDAGATQGFPIPAGGYFEHSNLSALYGYSTGGGDVNVLRQA